MAQRFNTVLLALILVVLCVLVALMIRQPRSAIRAGDQTRSPRHRQHHIASHKVAPTVTPVPAPTRRPRATVTPWPATATPQPATATLPPTTLTPSGGTRVYHSGDPILIVWPQKGQVWESAYWDAPDEGMYNELPGPGNRCSNAVSGPRGPLTATCCIPRDATPGYHTITLGEFRDYNGGTIATQYLKIFVSDEAVPTVEPPTATPDMQSV